MNSKKQFFKKYELLSTNNIPSIVGLGANSAVQLAVNKQTEKLYAVKKIHRKLAIIESSIHSQLNHPNIVKFIEAFFDSQTNSSYVVLEYVPNGTLSQYMNENQTLNKQNICKIFIGICKGLQVIHEKQIIHRDIKPANILLDSSCNIKICDFGNAINKAKSNQVCGTLEYMAPQIISQKGYNSKVDVWAVGVMLYQLLEGKLPFSYKNVTNMLQQIKQPLQFTKNISINFVQIIERMLRLNPQERPQHSQVIQYLQKVQISAKFYENSQKNPNNYQVQVQVQRQRVKTTYQSQNSTDDQLNGDFVERLIFKKDNSASKPMKCQGVISLKTFRPMIQPKKTPRIIVRKPLNKSLTGQISHTNMFKPVDTKLSIKQALRRIHL